ncbi:MAG: polymorphic toxin-type HINT domain-containing protein [Planctomycetota bacterium]
MSGNDRQTQVRVFASWALVSAGFIVSGWLIFGDKSTSAPSDQKGHAVTQARSRNSLGYTTKPIEEIQVGDRVFAQNPLVADAERATWVEPDWNEWLHLSLVMPREDGSELKIELLRPESWALEQVSYIAGKKDKPSSDQSKLALSVSQSESLAITKESPGDLIPFAPLRPFFRRVSLASALLDTAESELAGLIVELDLPEMGASGSAFLIDVAACPPVCEGEGQPVTATFSHPPSTAVLNVIFEGESQPIGVTDNHLFWSVDRQQFMAIGEMEIGETVQTFHGNTKRIQAKLPRPGPQVVYNLEVYGEHVYFVGEQGLLAHNEYPKTIDPNELNFSQGYVNGQTKRYEELMRISAKDGGWDWYRFADDHATPSALRVIDVDGQLVSLDNRRLLAAQNAGLKEVPIVVVKPEAAMPGGGTFGKNLAKKLNSRPRNRPDLPKIKLPPQGTRSQPTVVD